MERLPKARRVYLTIEATTDVSLKVLKGVKYIWVKTEGATSWEGQLSVERVHTGVVGKRKSPPPQSSPTSGSTVL